MYSNIKFLASVMLVGALLASPVLAAGASITHERFVIPEVVKVVTPTNIPDRYINTTVRLSLTIDAQGHPQKIQVIGDEDPTLNQRLLPCVAKWRFAPARRDGKPITQKVVLPLILEAKS